jgi:sulfofructose kinase
LASVLCVGHAVQDFVFTVPEFPDRASKFRASAFESVGGGPAATAAVAIARLGGRAVLAARIGADAVGELIRAELERERIDCRWLRAFAGCTSSLSSVLVDARGERQIVNYTDARMPESGDWLPTPEALGAQAVLADVRWPAGALRALQLARAAGVPGVLDADRPLPAQHGDLIAAASHVAFSLDGLADLVGSRDPGEALIELSRGHAAAFICTVGASGLLIAAAGKLRTQPAFSVPVVDTLGAGDVWHGAFALGLATVLDLDVACRRASAAAALKVSRRGGRSGAPSLSEVEALLTR